MEEIKVDFDMYLEAYETVEEKRRTFDLKVLDIEIAELQEKVVNDEKDIQTFTQERIDELNQINHANLSFEQYAKYFMKDIRICEDKIAQLKEERTKREKDQDQFEKLQGHKNTIRANAKKEKDQKVNLLESKLQNEMLNEELQQLQEKYNEILLLEEQDPKCVKNEKYKTFLQNKIQSKQKEIKDYQEPIKKQIKGINDNYLKFLKNLGKVDRGEKIDDLDYIFRRLDHQDAQIKKDQVAKQQEEQESKLDELNKKRVQDPSQAWDEAILEEQKRKLDELNKNRVQDPDQAWDKAILEEQKRKLDELNKNRVQDPDQAWDEAILEEQKRKLDELNKNRVQDPDQAWDKAILEEQKRKLDELNKNRVQDPDQAWDEAILEEQKRKSQEKNKQAQEDIFKNAEIIIGRSAKVIINNTEQKIPKKVVREAFEMDHEELLWIIEEYEGCKKYCENFLDIYEGIDPAVINVIDKANLHAEDKEELLVRYLESINQLFNAEDMKDIAKIEKPFQLKYDLKDISKTNVYSRIRGTEIDESTKYKINEQAYLTNRVGHSEIIGDGYNPNFLSRAVAKITGNKIKRLPTLGEQQGVAEKYNELRNSNSTSDINRMTFTEKLRVPAKATRADDNVKRKKLNNLQISELRSLHESQTLQEKNDDEAR
jgi:hypothetical protein